MKCNVGTTDRVLRIIAGIVIIVAGLYFRKWWGLIGLIPLLTSIFAWCPLYTPFGISTRCKKDEEDFKSE